MRLDALQGSWFTQFVQQGELQAPVESSLPLRQTRPIGLARIGSRLAKDSSYRRDTLVGPGTEFCVVRLPFHGLFKKGRKIGCAFLRNFQGPLVVSDFGVDTS